MVVSCDPVANPTTLDALNGGRVLVANVATTLQGFTLTNGNGGPNGGGGGLYAAGALTVTDVSVYSNTSAGGGGGGRAPMSAVSRCSTSLHAALSVSTTPVPSTALAR